MNLLFLQTTDPNRLESLRRFLEENWPLLVPLVLGFLAIYWLLPHVRRSWLVPGALTGVAALVLAGVMLIRWEFVLVEGVLFYAFSGLAILGGGLMVTQRNPVHAALSFALVVLSTCGLFLLLGAPFLMAATIIIYAGAIVVTFLFVIMLAQQGGLSSADQRSREPFLATLAGFLLIFALGAVLKKNYETRELDHLLGQMQQAAEARDREKVNDILGDPAHVPSLEIVDRLKKYFQVDKLHYLAREDAQAKDPVEKAMMEKELRDRYEDLPTDLELVWSAGDVAMVNQKAAEIHRLGLRLRAYIGSLSAPANLPLSTYSGNPANAPLQVTTEGRVKETLRASNVAAVGRSLYSDHLVAVELAGMLLLVATIGAIIIAGRRGEELR